MRKLVHAFVGLAFAAPFLAQASPASAQNIKSYVSAIGSDASDCSFTAPCRFLQRAHDQTSPGGEISCLTPGAFSSVIISRSITIDCGSSPIGSTFFFPSSVIVVNGGGIVVTIRNMSINGSSAGSAFPAIDFQNGAKLNIENCHIHFWPGIGLRFQPAAPGSQLIIANSIIENNGSPPSSGGGIQVIPQSGGSAGVVLNNVTFSFNVTAMVLSSGAGTIGVDMKDSVVSSSRSNGILALAGSTINFIIDHSSLTNNVGNAIQSSGANSVVRIGNSTIAGNQTGLSAAGGGQILSYQNNEINGNGTDGTPTGVLNLK